MNCLICDEKFNKTKHFKVTCLYCNFEACRECCKTFILMKENTCCMNPNKKPNGEPVCNKEWTRKFMLENFTKKFVNNEWKHMLEKICFIREKQLLPATMNYIEQKKEKDKIKKEIADISATIKELRERQDNLTIMLRNGGDMLKTPFAFNTRICADPECRGYLNTQWRCGICEKITCNNCNKLKPIDRPYMHVCNEDDVATAELLLHDTKPCPRCKIPIHKTEGCDQMWCVECHTAFSWKTGNIETRVHNPHYYEWQRQQNGGIAPRVQGDMECGRGIQGQQGQYILHYMTHECFKFLIQRLEKQNSFANKIQNLKSRNRQLVRIFVRIVRFEFDELERYNVDEYTNNEDLRAMYLEKSINENRFKQLLQQRDKNNKKKREIFAIGNLLLTTFIDIIYRFRHDWKEYKTELLIKEERELIRENNTTNEVVLSIDKHIKFIDKYLNEISGIVKYCNQLLAENKEIYGGSALIIMIGNIANVDMNQRMNYNIFQRIR